MYTAALGTPQLRRLFATLVGATAISWSASANAQEQSAMARYLSETPPAPSKSFELSLGTAYTQGLGHVAPGKNISTVSGAGFGIGFEADYRIVPAVSVGLETQYQEFANGNNGAAHGLAANAGVTYHTTPERRGDFWLRLGTGYRLLWDVHPEDAIDTTNLYHGLQLATLKLGYDIRTSSDVAIGPVIGADLQSFSWRDGTRLTADELSTFLYAGLQVRLNTNVERGTHGIATR